MSQIAGLQDFRQEGSPADLGTFLLPCEALSFQFTFSGTTYICSVRSGERGWVLIDFGTVASTVLNAAGAYINGLGGGTHHICANSVPYSITLRILVYNNMVLEGSGWGTILKLANLANERVIMNADPVGGNSYFEVRDLQVDGNRANQNAAGTIGIELRNASSFAVTHCYVHDTYYDGMGCWEGSHDGEFVNNLCHSTSNRHCIFVEYGVAPITHDIIVEGNITYSSSNTGSGINITGGPGTELYRITVINNVSYSNGQQGIQLGDLRGCTCTGNVVYNNASYGILLIDNIQNSTLTANISQGNADDGICLLTSTCKLVTISANVSFNNATDGILLYGASSNTIVGNVCYHNTRYGIYLRNGASDNVVSSNICYDEPVAVQSNGLILNNDADDNLIMLNWFTGHTNMGIQILTADCDRNVVIHNRLGGNTNGPISDAGTGTIFEMVTLPFVDGTASITANGAPKGWRVAAANEFAITYGVMPPECQQVMKIRVLAVGLAAPGAGNQMLIDLAANGAQPDEVYTGEAIAVNSKESNETAFAINDIVTWTFTPADDSDIGDLVAGDCLEIKMIYRAAVAPDIATNALLRCVDISYV